MSWCGVAEFSPGVVRLLFRRVAGAESPAKLGDFELVGMSYLVAVSTRIPGGQEMGMFCGPSPHGGFSCRA